MPFDNTAMRAFIRFLVRDPGSDSIGDTDLHNNYLVPAYKDWWYRFEHRPNKLITASQELLQGYRSVVLAPANPLPALDLIDQLRIDGYTDGSAGLIPFSPNVQHAMVRADLNRIRYLQESEGATGEPALGALQTAAGLTTTFLWAYPIADAGNNPPTTAGYMIAIYGRGSTPTFSTGATSAFATDPVSARYIARLAAYNLARALDLPVRKRRAILSGMPEWARVHFDVDRFVNNPSAPEEILPLWRKKWPSS